MLRLAVRVRRAEAELVLAELLELAPAGVEEVDLGDAVEYAVYGAPGELPALPALRAVAGAALVEVSTSEVADDWAERWREFHRPLVLADGGVTVRPPWEPPGDTPIDVVIDPGRAFGTGAHATTRLCLELLVDLGGGGSLLDLGCGSGVLAIVAARLGFAPVVAVDNDVAAVEAASANARANGVTALDVRRLDLRRDPLPEAGTVVANLLSPLLIGAARAIAAAAAGRRARVLASGILEPEADAVARAFAAEGFEVTARRARGEWAALALSRTHG